MTQPVDGRGGVFDIPDQAYFAIYGAGLLLFTLVVFIYAWRKIAKEAAAQVLQRSRLII